MSSNAVAIRVNGVSKLYRVYDRPQDRLKQMVVPRLQSLIKRARHDYFREFWALRDVSFNVTRGQTVGIIGGNGAGKSTLLQIICGTLAPSDGVVETSGRVAALLELGAGFNAEFTGRENVFMYGSILGLSHSFIEDRYQDILDFADIGDFVNQPVKTYSSGMFVRLAFAVATCIDPDILIIDEALAVGDVKFQAKCFRRFSDLVNRGTTILFVSHSPDQIVRHCDQAILLSRGRVDSIGDPKPTVNRYLDQLFGLNRPDHPPPTEKEQSIAIEKPPAKKTKQRGQDPLSGRAGYNPDEHRSGIGGAEIIDAFIGCENTHSARIESGSLLLITLVTRFLRRADDPIYSVKIRTPDGIAIFANNSRDFRDGPLSSQVSAGQMTRVRFSIQQYLKTGEYLLSFGVATDGSQGVRPLDRRLDCLHIKVTDGGVTEGLVDFPVEITL